MFRNMREIKFRGIADNCCPVEIQGKWIYGLPKEIIADCERFMIRESKHCRNYYIETETLSQYTNLKDKNNVEIYEGDIVKYVDADGSDVFTNMGEVVYDTFGFTFSNRNSVEMNDFAFEYDVEVIGNIYENPELLKE